MANGTGSPVEVGFVAPGTPGDVRRLEAAGPASVGGGRHFRAANPAPQAHAQAGGPAIVVTGRKGPAMRRAALLGDGWMPYLFSADRYARSVARIEELAGDAGRKLTGFRWLAYLMVGVDRDPAAARRSVARFLGDTYRQDFDAFLDPVAVPAARA